MQLVDTRVALDPHGPRRAGIIWSGGTERWGRGIVAAAIESAGDSSFVEGARRRENPGRRCEARRASQYQELAGTAASSANDGDDVSEDARWRPSRNVCTT